jgi:membrane protein YqaA with SNARE-associated domain
LETIRRFFHLFIKYVHAALSQPGLTAFAAVFAISFADAVVPIPGGMDGIVATAILATEGKLLYVATYIVIAAMGNALGNIIIYAIGYKGGEVFLEKRLGKDKFNAMRAKFEKHEVLTLVLASMMPPPFPFKTVVFSAAVFEVDFRRFLLGIFLGRLFRFSIVAALALMFGPQIIGILGSLVRQHLLELLLSLAAILFVVALVWHLRQRKESVPSQ